MTQNGIQHPRRRGLLLMFAGVILVVGMVVWLTNRSGSRLKSVFMQGGGSSEHSQSGQGRGGDTSSSRPDKTNTGKRPGGASASDQAHEVPQFPMLEQVLSDGGLSNQEAAKRLLEIVVNQSLSQLEREEALAHGLDLDFERFLEILADPELPQPMAQRFFDEMLNHNDKRDLQVRACISLMDHEDPAMKQDAAAQLAFYIGLEEWAGKPDVLRQEAYAFLEEWAKRPKPQPEPLDPSAEIPETAPFTPPQPDEEEGGEELD